jgi:hypothetical protein
MAFPNRPNRRVNWDYVCRLCEEVERLGYQQEDIPDHILRSPWPVIRDHIVSTLHLQVCTWCKLPKSDAEMGTGRLCLEHQDIMQEHISKRRGHASTRTKRMHWARRKLYGDEQESSPLGASNLERLRKLEAELTLRHPEFKPQVKSLAESLFGGPKKEDDK